MSDRATASLVELQQWLGGIILDPDQIEGDAASLTSVLACPDAEHAKTRLRAYTNGYPARLRAALAEAFPALEHVAGKHRFADIALRYRSHVPAGGYSLTDVGGALAEFLTTDPLGDDYPFAADLARLEWAVLCAFHSREHDPVDPASLASWGLEQWNAAVLRFQPSVAVVRSRWPIIDIWEARETPIEEVDIDLDDRPQIALVRREGFLVACDRLEQADAVALESLLGGATLGEAAEALAEAGGDAQAVTGSFAHWMQAGLITAVRAGGA